MKATKMDLKNILGELTGITDDLLDDGRDYEDERKNASFDIDRRKVERIGERLSMVEVEGVDEETLDAEWRKAWGNCNNKNLPECQYNHHVNYINALIALLGGNDNDDENKIRSIRSQTGLSQQAFADRYHIPKRTIENWERRVNEPPAYVVELLQFRIDNE